MDLLLHFLCSWRAFSPDIIWYYILDLNKLKQEGAVEWESTSLGHSQILKPDSAEWNDIYILLRSVIPEPISLLLDSPKSGTPYVPYAFKALAGRMYLYHYTLVGMISMFWRAFPPHNPGLVYIYNEITLWLLIAVASLKWQAIIGFDIGRHILEV